jgi:hypothetical protein
MKMGKNRDGLDAFIASDNNEKGRGWNGVQARISRQLHLIGDP